MNWGENMTIPERGCTRLEQSVLSLTGLPYVISQCFTKPDKNLYLTRVWYHGLLRGKNHD